MQTVQCVVISFQNKHIQCKKDSKTTQELFAPGIKTAVEIETAAALYLNPFFSTSDLNIYIISCSFIAFELYFQMVMRCIGEWHRVHY